MLMEIEDVAGQNDTKYVPECDSSLKPFEGQVFKSLEEGIKFYKLYAAACGFDVRRGTRRRHIDGTEIRRYVYCNREGEKNAATVDSGDGLNVGKQKRRRVSRRFGCKARVVFKFMPHDGYAVQVFIEHHTHTLVSDAFKKYLKANRNLDYFQKTYILNCARVNIGPMKTYNLFKQQVGDYASIGCTSTEVKNFSRDLKAYVIGVDAQMMLDKLFMKREFCSSFYFDYTVDQDDQLSSVFWSDPIARKNYALFGDVVSFDATYGTNRYKMIFAPFTGLDNHGKCVTFGAALMSGESKKSYAWVLSRFKDCMGEGPRLLITDQDPTLKYAVEKTLVGTRHRLCMWHIMLKVPEKVPKHIRKDEVFMQRFNALVWTDFDEPFEFENKWHELISDYGLSDESWFIDMYGIREFWIPAFFRDFSLSGLFRTTSPSESANHFYSGFLSDHSNLVEFFMQFESALDSQRHTVERLNAADESTVPELSTPLLFEKHAATIFTAKFFLKLQKEIESACYVCKVEKICEHDDSHEYWVNDKETGVFKVMVDKHDNHAMCSCKKFERLGLVCSHVFVILKDMELTTLPDKYVLTRWTKSARLHPIHTIAGGLDEQIVVNEENKLLMNQLISDFYRRVALVDGNNEHMSTLLRGIRELMKTLPTTEEISSSDANGRLFAQYYGASIPKEVTVLPPKQVSTKGSGGRLKQRKEKVIERMNKPPRKCSNCHQMTHHDARNCPNKEA